MHINHYMLKNLQYVYNVSVDLNFKTTNGKYHYQTAPLSLSFFYDVLHAILLTTSTDVGQCGRQSWAHSGTISGRSRWTDQSASGAATPDTAFGWAAISWGCRHGRAPRSGGLSICGGRAADGHFGGGIAAQCSSVGDILCAVRDLL